MAQREQNLESLKTATEAKGVEKPKTTSAPGQRFVRRVSREAHISLSKLARQRNPLTHRRTRQHAFQGDQVNSVDCQDYARLRQAPSKHSLRQLPKHHQAKPESTHLSFLPSFDKTCANLDGLKTVLNPPLNELFLSISLLHFPQSTRGSRNELQNADKWRGDNELIG